MTSSDGRSISPDIAALRALSHPTRLRILTHLRTEGPATASVLGARFGLHTGATSYHLRSLAKHGFVVEDCSRGNGRERWWKAAHEQTVTRADDATSVEAQQAADAFWQTTALMYAERMHSAMDERPLLPTPWRDASTLSDWTVHLPSHRAEAVVGQLRRLLGTLEDDPAGDAAPFTIQVQAFPVPGQVAPAETPQATTTTDHTLGDVADDTTDASA